MAVGLHWGLLISPRHVSHVGWDPQNGFDVSNSKVPWTPFNFLLPFYSPAIRPTPRPHPSHTPLRSLSGVEPMITHIPSLLTLFTDPAPDFFLLGR